MFKLGIHLQQRLSLILGCCLLSACASAGSAKPTSTPPDPLVERVIVQFKAPLSDPQSRIRQLGQQYQLGLSYERDLGSQFYVAQLQPPKTAAELQPYFQQISQEADVLSIEADLMMHTMPTQ